MVREARKREGRYLLDAAIQAVPAGAGTSTEWRTIMMVFTIACVFATAVTSVFVTALVSAAVKNQIVERQIRQLQYWQARAMRAEDPQWRQW